MIITSFFLFLNVSLLNEIYIYTVLGHIMFEIILNRF